MNGLERTFQFLETTPNGASLEVLVPALQAAEGSIRSRAITAMIGRDTLKGYESLIQSWDRLEREDRLLLLDGSSVFRTAVETTLASGDEREVLKAIDMVVTLSLTPLLPALLVPAESHASYTVRRAAQTAVMQLAVEEGTAARDDRERPAVRRPMLRTLAGSVCRFPVHGQPSLVDALLAGSRQNDAELLSLLGEGCESRPILLQRLESSAQAAVLSLLAGMLHRPRLSPDIEAIMARRNDARFRDALLDAVGCHLTTTTRKNLSVIGLPVCCERQHCDVATLSDARRVALSLVYAVADRDHVRALTMLLDAIDSVQPDNAVHAKGLTHALSRFPALNAPLLLRAAASHVCWEDELPAAGDPSYEPAVRLLHRMLRWLKVDDSPYAKPLRTILKALTIEAVMPELENFRPATQRRLGRVVMQVDPDAATAVSDQLRHPVLKRRLQGVRAAIALDIVERLREQLLRAAKNDHLEARVQAIEALQWDRSRSSYQLLLELSTGPVGPVRDAALDSLQRRDPRHD